MKNNKYKVLFLFLFCLLFAANVNAEETVIELETEKSIIDIEKEAIEATDGVILKYGDIIIRADSVKKLGGKNVLFAYGNVVFTQGTQTVKANELVFDMDTKKAKILSSESYDTKLKLRFGGEQTLSEPNKITIKNGWFTTSPYEEPNYKVNAEELLIYPNRKIVAKKIGVEVGGKTWFKFPYYVASLKPESQRATLFPYIGSDSERGLFGIWGFDYDKGKYAQGFVDFELSAKKKLALKISNDYTLWPGSSGNVFVKRFVVPIGNRIREWDFEWNHNIVNTPKKEKSERRFYDLGYGLWNFNYKNITTNLVRAADGVLLKDDYTSYVDTYKKIGFYDFKINQELGQNGEFNLDYYWTQNPDALRELTKINDFIVDRDEIDPRKTDVDLYKTLKYTNGNSDIAIKIDNEKFTDINPGYIGDLNSFRNKKNYSIDFKGPKIKLEYLDSNKDEYKEILNLKERDDADNVSLEDSKRWVQTTAYDHRKEVSLTLGNYYPFRQNEFFGYKPKTLSQYLTNNFYFGVETKHSDIKKKEYEYDFTRDNPAFNNLFLDSTTDDNSRIYKVYEDTDKIKRAKKIIYEKYRSQKINIGNDKIELPIRNSYLSFNFGFENRDYSEVYVPEFFKGRKIEDVDSKTGYKILRDAAGNEIKKQPSLNISTLNTKLFTTIFDNTAKINNKYDIKVTNEANLTLQKVNASGAMYNGNDIIDIPTNTLGINNNFNFYLGNMTFNYNFTNFHNRHFSGNWLKNQYVRNYFKFDIANKRFVSFDFISNDEYEFEDFKSERNLSREVQYGYLSDAGNSFLYKYTDKNRQYFPYNEDMGWNRKDNKEFVRDRMFSINYNEWGIDYTNIKSKINDIFGTSLNFGKPALKLQKETHKIGFVYDTSKMKNKKFESDHYFRISYGFGKKTYRDLNNTPLTISDDRYSSGSDYTTISLLYRYENNVKPKYEGRDSEGNIVKESNQKDFSVENANKNIIDNIEIKSDDRLFLNSEEEQAYKSYVEEETYKQNKFNLNDFNSKLQDLRKKKKYFQIGLDMEIDGSNSMQQTDLKGFNRLNDLTFKVEAGYLEKFFVRYAFVMEKPDRIYRKDPNRYSQYNFRRHDFETKYMFGPDPDKPWWIGAKVQYVQDGAPKSSDPEIFESSSAARRVNKITLGMATVSHRFENLEWEIGAGMKWDKPNNKKLGYYPVVTLKFGIVTFPEKNVQFNYTKGSPSFGAGL
ncbi:LPS-assembly protein LptD [Pseudoleptotrichia goodfellowii]|uniref:OstA-like protein n=1 Tax=Pseudoleptotrichia goodfellowii F0264 TaxID=596323 RepID=D0GMH8_9FUSO|nr:LPS-assembly protein LptD [Pseudoleptotrichia goodfellowii]EEY34699.1 OstA-like protein [Pseudoleptotrichia goodfellowii F0264]